MLINDEIHHLDGGVEAMPQADQSIRGKAFLKNLIVQAQHNALLALSAFMPGMLASSPLVDRTKGCRLLCRILCASAAS